MQRLDNNFQLDLSILFVNPPLRHFTVPDSAGFLASHNAMASNETVLVENARSRMY